MTSVDFAARKTSRPRTLRALLAVSAALLLVLSACSPVMTQNRYAAGDGARGDLGDQIELENFLIITEGQGEPGTFLGGITNRAADEVQVTLSITPPVEEGEAPLPPEQFTIAVEGQSTILMQPDDESVVLGEVPVPPGATLDVVVSASGAGQVTIPTPVLDGTIAPYDEYLPQEPATP